MALSTHKRGTAVALAAEFEQAVRARAGIKDEGTQETNLFNAIQSLRGKYPDRVLGRAHRVREMQNQLVHGREITNLTRDALQAWELECQSLIETFSGRRVNLDYGRHFHIPTSVFVALGFICALVVLIWAVLAYLNSIPKEQLNEILTLIIVPVLLIFVLRSYLKDQDHQNRLKEQARKRHYKKKEWWQ